MKALHFYPLLLIWACSPTPRPPAETMATLSPTDTVLILERTMCFGFCPTYRLAITSEGRARLEGTGRSKGFVRVLALSPNTVAALLGRFTSTGFFALDSVYGADHPLCQVYATDQPGAYLFANDGAKRHTVTHYFGCRGPQGTASDAPLPHQFQLLFALEGAIDSAAGTAAYVDSLTGSRGG